jgi:phosphate starvation-inducible PhoH-like protein
MTQVTLAEEGIAALFGTRDENLRHIERSFKVSLSARGNKVQITGDPERQAVVERLLQQLSALLDRGYRLQADDVDTAVRVLQEAPDASLEEFFLSDGGLRQVGDKVRPRSLSQRLYLQAMAESDLVISVGPAGTGKTYLAVAMAAVALQENRVRRVILARPAVEAGEKLGFLPGDLVDKVNPYLRPLYDALYDIIGFERVTRMLERGTIEVAPIAFMRGRTLNDSFIILDEAQNTTSEQMKMFLTRLGFGSKAVVTGDVTQIDLPDGRGRSGLLAVRSFLEGIPGLEFVDLTSADVVRHRIVQDIVDAYELHER